MNDRTKVYQVLARETDFTHPREPELDGGASRQAVQPQEPDAVSPA